MEAWLPPAISGLFSIAVVAFGARLINVREKNRRSEELDRADKDRQREAIAQFLQADRKLSATLLRDLVDINLQRDPKKMNPTTVVTTTRLRMLYFNDCLQELLTLDLSIHDPDVREAYNNLFQTCSNQYTEYRDFLNRYTNWKEDELPKFSEELTRWDDSLKEYRNSHKKLIEVARDRYRIQPTLRRNKFLSFLR